MVEQSADSTLPPSFEAVYTQALQFSSAPVLIAQLFSALNNSDGTTGDIVALIRTDTSLAVETLRLANSAHYGGIRVTTLEEALFRLGTREIVKLASHLVASTWLSVKVPLDEWDSRGFLRQSVCRAVAAEFLSRKLNISKPELAYTAGLLQDMGRLALVACASSAIPVIAATALLENLPWIEAETRVLGFDSIALGTALMKGWKFPEELLVTVEYMRDPALGPESCQPLLTAIHAARLVADSILPAVINAGHYLDINCVWLKQYRITRRLLEDTMIDTVSRVSEQLDCKLQSGELKY